MEETSSLETLVTFSNTARHQIPENHNLNISYYFMFKNVNQACDSADSMQDIPSAEANNQEISRNFMKHEGSWRCSQQPATGPHAGPDEFNPQLPTVCL
jgi:hypothetical protein